MDRGYVKLWRKSIDTGWLKNHKLWAFWSYCLIRATYRERDVLVGNQMIHLVPGQFIFGRKKAALELGLSEREIRTVVRNLEILGNLTIKTTNKFSIFTIINWSIYQSEENENDHQIDQYPTSNRPATDQQPTTNKNIKNIKKERINTYTVDFLSFWTSYPKKVGKDAAWRAWKNRNGSRPPIEEILKAIETQKQADQWTRDNGQYIPNPATWINQGRWGDEIKEEKKGFWS